MYVTTRNEHDPDFRRDFYDASPHWNSMATIDQKLERQQFKSFTEKARKGTTKAFGPLASAPLLVRRQMMYARKIKEEGIPAAKPPPPFIVKKPTMSQWSHRKIRQFDIAKPYHDGAYGEREALGGRAWSCCGDMDEHSPGCRRHLSNEKRTLYD
jgi:hypothetical protein